MGIGRKKKNPRTASKPKPRAISAADQILDMAKKYPEFTARRLGNEAVWEGRFQPSQSCATYLVRIEALTGQRPWVTVLEPELRIPRDKWLETHRFSHGGLCLHLHEQWTRDQLIAEMIVPWTAIWLINYEYWLASGLWLGGGEHPSSRENK